MANPHGFTVATTPEMKARAKCAVDHVGYSESMVERSSAPRAHPPST